MTEDPHDQAAPISTPTNADDAGGSTPEQAGPPVLSVEELDPVELVEVDEDGPEPADGWGEDGAGSEQNPDADEDDGTGAGDKGAETTGGAV